MDNELARIEKLKGLENWGTRKFQVKILSQAADALEIIDGNIEKPRPPSAAETSSTDSVEYRKNIRAWNVLDSKAQKIIAITVSEQPLLHIMNCQSSREIWNKLHEVFENKNETAKHILQQQWYTLGRETADDMATHIAKIKDLAYRLKMLDEPVSQSDSMIMTKILMTLPSSYQHSNSVGINKSGPKDPVKPHSKTHNGGTAEKASRESRKQTFAAKTKRRQTQGERESDKPVGKCFKCGKVGHWKRDCKSKASNANNTKIEKSSTKTENRGAAFVGQIASAAALNVSRKYEGMVLRFWCKSAHVTDT